MKRITSLLIAAVVFLTLVTACDVEPIVPQTPLIPQVSAKNITITEVMPDNEKLCLGHDLDWVELYNGEESAVNLDGYILTDDPSGSDGFSLAGLQIPGEGYLAVVLPENAAFHLSAQGETVYLLFGGNVISQLTFAASEQGESFSSDGVCEYPTPGYANTADGYRSYLEGQSLPELILSEVLSSNSAHLPFNGQYYDLVEVKNNSDAPLNLAEYTLTDKRKEPSRFTFPAVTLNPGEHYVIYCSGEPSLGSNHTSFKISASGESIYLTKGGTFIDVLTVPADLGENESYGRYGKDLVYFQMPTMGFENSPGFATGLAAPSSDLPSGIYGEPVSVTLAGSGTIYYTLDGSRPSTESSVYTDPIPVDDVTTIRTFCVDNGRVSSLTAYTYVIGGQHQLPVVTVSIPQEYLTGEQGILNHIDQTYEYEGVVTLIEGGEEKFSVPFGFRLHGNGSRACPKQNFQLRFRSEYGAGKLKYPLFDNREFDEYNSLLLKGGSEDWNSAVMRDEVATAIVEGTTNLYAQAIKPVVLYLGGEYWGIYYFRERYSDDYVASHFNVSEESVDLLFSSGAYTQSGSNRDFLALVDYVKTHDMTTDENYAYLTQRIDVVSLMDWYICRSYMGDKDLANIRRFRSSEGDGKWRWMYFDLDWAFWHTNENPVSSILQNRGADYALIHAVLSNPQGRDAFLRRYGELMNTVLKEEYILGVIDSVASSIESEIPRDRERWGRTVDGWKGAVNRLRNYVKDGARNNHVKQDLQNYFGLTEEEMQSYFGD